LYILNWLHFLV